MESFTEKVTSSQQRAARRNALVALANLSDAFNRMLSEPKRMQTEVENIHRFVVLSHILTSYIATLAHYLKIETDIYKAPDFVRASGEIQRHFTNAIGYLKQDKYAHEMTRNKEALHKLTDTVNKPMQKRKEEIQQGQLETPTTKDLFDLKSIADQFNLVYNVAADINKIAKSMTIN